MDTYEAKWQAPPAATGKDGSSAHGEQHGDGATGRQRGDHGQKRKNGDTDRSASASKRGAPDSSCSPDATQHYGSEESDQESFSSDTLEASRPESESHSVRDVISEWADERNAVMTERIMEYMLNWNEHVREYAMVNMAVTREPRAML